VFALAPVNISYMFYRIAVIFGVVHAPTAQERDVSDLQTLRSVYLLQWRRRSSAVCRRELPLL